MSKASARFFTFVIFGIGPIAAGHHYFPALPFTVYLAATIAGNVIMTALR